MIFATGIGGIETLLNAYDVLKTKGPGRVSPFMVPMLMANAPAGHIAMTFGLTGANFATISACSSSNHAIFEAMRLLREGTLDLCIAGGSESATLPLTVAAFSQMTALTKNPDPEVASRPFDAQRRRLRALRGRLRADHGDRGAREGARRADLLRGGRRGSERRRVPHHGAGPEGLGRRARDAVGAGGRGRRAERGRLHQRPRHVDAAERRVGGRRHHRGPRRSRDVAWPSPPRSR